MATKLEHQIQKLLSFHRKGIYTWNEIVAQFSDLAFSPEFFEHLPSLPEEIVSELRQIGLRAPSHPEDVFILRSYCGPPPGHEYENFLEKERIRCYWRARKLREFFFPGLQIPPFEPIKLLGTVEESVRIEDSVILFGEFQSWLIRKHPVHCVTPRGQKVPITVTGHGFIKHKHENSPDSFVRKYGRPSLSLGGEVSLPEQVPTGSIVSVDRTEATSIPEVGQAEPAAPLERGGT